MGPVNLFALAMAFAAPEPPATKCQVSRMVEFPITMAGRRPMVAAKFGDKESRFIVDSGAFYSTISTASATEFGMKMTPAPPNFWVAGIGGNASVQVATSKNFSLAGITIPRVEFIAGGSDTGTAGLIGQNILGLWDVEYDLPHGAIRLMKTTDCSRTNLAYWAGDKPVTTVALEGKADGLFKPHTIATVLLNGVKVRAVFDTGAESSFLTLAAAKRAGVTVETPGVVPEGLSSGIGSRKVQTWLAPFDKIEIGGEAIPHPKIEIAQFDLENADMLIGADFFLTHRMFVSNANRIMYLTYEGGPVFGLSPKGARTADGKRLDLTNKAAEPTTAEEYSRRGAVEASNNRPKEALADFDKAIAMAPKEGRYLYQRAMIDLGNSDHEAALADLDHAVALSPGDADARLTRASLRLRNDDKTAAIEDIKAADAVLAPTSDKRLALASLYDGAGMPEASIPNFDLWLKSHPEDSSRPAAFNGRCWARALLNRELDKALSDCNAALKAQPRNGSFLDSRALVRLRRGELPQALADYDAVIQGDPREAWSIYMRGIVQAKMGNAAKAKADRDAALSINPKVGDRARKYGLEN
jgi:tetratricopeptide (TPR) repeat protein/predicted aspartyl protease